MIRELSEVIARNRAGSCEVVPSVCSTQADVLAASLLLAHERQALVLVEATSNQVNQFGGYTGMTPGDFAARLAALAERLRVDRTQIVLGEAGPAPGQLVDQVLFQSRRAHLTSMTGRARALSCWRGRVLARRRFPVRSCGLVT